ncbi:hypothetical protein HH1059_13790 [Halorhodospira halochloris]|uniref:Uncharacterized protein n=1 Tax=Halorhodospira halochloris TaxID=1052 RepID=A0A2Z6EZV7_HALHR|nr:hypothetical protein [Halorhodospira halochloris]MBK1652986.1 hypothetical protein [Halorhodospira halochloris]BBE11064.1 hypothetical protein HH1059_13790 [Halorhodospira halochloris]
MTIPNWNHQGVLPPYVGSQTGSDGRSPYPTTLVEVLEHFGTSPERCKVLRGFLDYRQELYSIGVKQGFQWVNGSFAENVEILEERPPEDVDVVTFFAVPSGESQQTLLEKNADVFRPASVKRRHGVDGYPVPWDGGDWQRLVKHASYWYSLWSHRRNHLWKGFVQIPLEPSEEVPRAVLDNITSAIGENK